MDMVLEMARSGGRPRKGWFMLGALLLGALVLLMAFFGSFYTVDQGTRGVQLRYGAVIGVAQPGLHLKLPFVDEVKFVSVQNQTQVYEKLEAYSRDQQPATMRVSVSFHIPDDQVQALYAQYGGIEALVERLVSRKLPDELKNVFGGYNAISVIQDRTQFGIDVSNAVKKGTVGPLRIDGVQVEEIEFSQAYEDSIEKRMMAEVEIQTKRQNLDTEKINAEISVTKARARADSALAEATAQAEATRIRGDAEAAAIKARGEALRQNAGLVQLTVAEKWDGRLPQTMLPGGGVPLLDLRATQGK
ncbi:prohibitin family protein [Frateuria hangzhouensis]|uniref:prohibitin family protein n=1 Tax=Frateuria hangzhouensis TaxID=2995589 RepID=UPI002260E7EF|nr:prohibitin family protein [Frateuria sp. STR12]MCX7512856.1 prohibitin family protein [Frateuria sp. STR12]